MVRVETSTQDEKELQDAGLAAVSNTIRGDLPEGLVAAAQQRLWSHSRSIDADHLFTYFETGTIGTVPDADGPSIPAPTDHHAWMPTSANPITHAWLMAQVRAT